MKQLVLADMTDRDVLDFVDDVLVFSESEEQHVRDVSDVLDRFERHDLIIKASKCNWMVSSVEFLGFTIHAGPDGTSITPMKSKVEAVLEWPRPRTQTQLRSFLGFTNTFRSFVDGYARVATPLLQLTKKMGASKSRRVEWSDVAQRSFETLKAAICNSAVLAVADDNKPFVLNTDASDYAVGAVLSQLDDSGRLRPIGFVSEKLSDREYGWSPYEKELYAVIVALRHWSMWLMHARHPVTVNTDHASLRFLLEQPKLTAKQTRWFAFLSNFPELDIRYVRAGQNASADALSRRADHDVGVEARNRIRSDIVKRQFTETFKAKGVGEARLNTLLVEARVGGADVTDAIVKGYADDPECVRILADPGRYQYELHWGLLQRIDDGSILVPSSAGIRTRLLAEVHDAPTSGHLGVAKTQARLAANFHWPNQYLDVADWCRSCMVCQKTKHRTTRVPGLMQPIAIQPKGHTIALDFVGPFTRTARGHDAILVVVDTFSKRAFYEPTTIEATAKQTAGIVFDRVVRHQGLPRAVRSDRDSRFVGDFWRELWTLLGAKMQLTTAFHHESNGLVEKQNGVMIAALRAFVNDRGSDWDLRLPACELAYNSSVHSSTKFTPFMLDIGIEPRLPIDLTRPEPSSTTLEAAEFLDRVSQAEVMAFRNLLQAQQRQKEAADRSRRDVQYNVGDFAWLATADLAISRRPGSKKLLLPWTGPFKVLAVHGDVNVQLELPSSWTIHNIVHISRLKKATLPDPERFPGRAGSAEPGISAFSPEHIEVEDARQDGVKDSTAPPNLGDYSERGAAMREVEREEHCQTQEGCP